MIGRVAHSALGVRYDGCYNACMNKPLKIVAFGNSAGVILPKDILASLKLDRGDELYPVMTPNGVELRVYDPAFEVQMEAARTVMKRRRNVLRELAK
jgi:putative addiction module antidote